MAQCMDLTQRLTPGVADWNGCCGFRMTTVMDYPQGCRVQELSIPNGIGTHMDAPSHFVPGAIDIDRIALEHLVVPGVMIDVSANAGPDTVVSVQHILDHESQYGVIEQGSAVLLNTGWSRYWAEPLRYRNEDAQGVMHFPRLSLQAVDCLLTRGIEGIAIDTLSPDGGDMSFPVHHRLLGAGKYIIENIRVPPALPALGFTVVALPIKIGGATEAPCRVIALL